MKKAFLISQLVFVVWLCLAAVIVNKKYSEYPTTTTLGQNYIVLWAVPGTNDDFTAGTGATNAYISYPNLRRLMHTYHVYTNTLSGTNAVIDMLQDVVYIEATNNVFVLSITNAPTSDTNMYMNLLIVKNIKGSAITIDYNRTNGWNNDLTDLPLTITNLDIHTIPFLARGTNGTNVIIGNRYQHPE